MSPVKRGDSVGRFRLATFFFVKNNDVFIWKAVTDR